jgi:hypothetical protein
MTGNLLYRCLLMLALFTIRPLASIGNDGSPHHTFHLNREIIIQALRDSLPENKKPEESSNKDNTQQIKEVATINEVPTIKEVPKSRKQIKPIAIPAAAQIKPIQVIKPKIVKPTIRIRLN